MGDDLLETCCAHLVRSGPHRGGQLKHNSWFLDQVINRERVHYVVALWATIGDLIGDQ